MKAIDRAKAHFAQRTPKKIQVPEWSDEQGAPLSLYFNPMTVTDRDHLIRLEKRHGAGLELLVHVLILHARDAQGNPLFTLEDKPALMHQVDPDVLARIVDHMIDDLDPDALKKKSNRNPTSPSA